MCNCTTICMNGQTQHTVRVKTVQRYRVEARFGRKGDKGDPGSGGSGGGWQEGETIDVVNPITLVQDDQLKDIELKKIIHFSGVSANWARQGITHDDEAGTLDFTNWIYGNTFEGYIDFDFKTL